MSDKLHELSKAWSIIVLFLTVFRFFFLPKTSQAAKVTVLSLGTIDHAIYHKNGTLNRCPTIDIYVIPLWLGSSVRDI
jgi:hypothetical protein